MKIPLHSLVLHFIPDLEAEYEYDDRFLSYEVLSYAKIAYEIFGSSSLYHTQHDVWSELKHRVYTKLWLGERVVINASQLKKSDRDGITQIAVDLGINIFYIFDQYPEDKDLSKGDGVAQIVTGNFELLRKFEHVNLSKEIKENYSGLCVIGDVHGNHEKMMNAVLWAKMRNTLPVFLGDIIDFGAKSIECVEEVYNLVIRNQAIFLMGNHERKIFKWLNKLHNKSIKLHLSEANKQTIDQIKKMSLREKKCWEAKFRTLMNLGHIHLFIDNVAFIHAAYHPDMLDYKNRRTLPFELEKRALFGEFIEDPDWTKDVNNAAYKWIDDIPKNMTVFVGHEPRNMFKPYHEINVNGGEVYFMDTGCGKGGHLTSADLRLDGGNYRLTNFNSW